MQTPAGITHFGERYIVCDFEQNCLFVLSDDLNVAKKIGEIGSAPLQFLEPTGVTSTNEFCYVLDAGNNRIQILDTNLQYVEDIPLPSLNHQQGGYRYIDIAVSDDGILYISTDSTSKEDTQIRIIQNGEVLYSELGINGYLSQANGKVYALETLELFEEGDSMVATNGMSHLYELTGETYTEIGVLPNKATPTDFLVYDGEFISASASFMKLYSFTWQGDAKNSLCVLPELSTRCYLISTDTGFILNDAGKSSMYVMTRKE